MGDQTHGIPGRAGLSLYNKMADGMQIEQQIRQKEKMQGIADWIIGMMPMALDFYNKAIPKTADVTRAAAITGTRGTFSGELGGRMSGTQTIAAQQLEETRNLKEIMAGVEKNTAGGAFTGA